MAGYQVALSFPTPGAVPLTSSGFIAMAVWRLPKRFLSADERAKERMKSQMQAASRG